MQENHKKHGKGVKAKFGLYGRNELAILGTPCGVIHTMATEIIRQLNNEIAIGYFDADHSEEPDIDDLMKSGAIHSTINKQDFYQHVTAGKGNQLNPKLAFTSDDLVLINGNHFQGECQLVFLDGRKTDSLKRNIHKLTNILAFIDFDGNEEVPDFVQASPSYSNQIPILSFENKIEITSFVQTWMISNRPKLNGLVLSGGLSTRMGTDKGEIIYHKTPQREHLAQLLTPFCEEVFISTNGANEVISDFAQYPDAFMDMGPLGAILTAFKNQPDTAWLILACDMPFVNDASIKKLVDERSTKAEATAYKRSDAEFPEPLFAIYEPKIYSRALQMLSLGIQCPRKLLINSRVNIVQPSNNQVLMNANFPEEREEAFSQLKDARK